ncbi:putative holin-like toxin [Bacillus haynesii]|uniref:putative holin-like toxin n=1 Tax=Bacillus haynesii TaxID=1925021 RepID=UPI002DBEB4D2|nr:putative holin-like toxin [Bacillus haynesii]
MVKYSLYIKLGSLKGGLAHTLRKGVKPMMSTFQSLSLMFMFGMFILALLTYINLKKK